MKKRVKFQVKVYRAIARPPINEAMIAADLKVTLGSVQRVVEHGIKYGYIERIEVPGYVPHLGLTPDGLTIAQLAQPKQWTEAPLEPAACPTCKSSESPKVFTMVLGWECRACRKYRMEFHQNPATRLDEPGQAQANEP